MFKTFPASFEFLNHRLEVWMKSSKWRWSAEITAIQGQMLEMKSLEPLPLGTVWTISLEDHMIQGEIISTQHLYSKGVCYDAIPWGLKTGTQAWISSPSKGLFPHESWIGRVINALGVPCDAKGPLVSGSVFYNREGSFLPAYERKGLGKPLETGISALDWLTPLRMGQRVGLFASAGLGKTVLMGQLARFFEADRIVVGLIGERNREVKEFIEEELGDSGLSKSTVFVATSNESALLRVRAAEHAMLLAEFYRDQGHHVLLLMDSLTRWALALREVGLLMGEAPAHRGFPASILSRMAHLVERAGPGTPSMGSITAVFTVLVEGDDLSQDFIAEGIKGLLDGHIILDPSLAQKGIFPALNILKSLSRVALSCYSSEQKLKIFDVRQLIDRFLGVEELVRLGVYRKGTDELTDRALNFYTSFIQVLCQDRYEKRSLQASWDILKNLLK